MAATLIAALAAQIVGAPGGDPIDVESDVAAAKNGTLNVFVPPAAGNGGFLTVEPLNIPQNFLAAPGAPVLASAVSGALGATTYFVKTTYVNAFGETLASVEASLAVAANSVLVVDSPPALAGATGYNVYVSTATGTETKQNTTAIAIGTNWQEPNTGLIAGAALPGANTTALSNGACTVVVSQGAGSLTGNYGTLVATLPATIPNLSDPADVENDSTAAGDGSVNVFVPPAAGSGGFLTLEPIAKAILSALSVGACSVFICQGSASLTLNPTQ